MARLSTPPHAQPGAASAGPAGARAADVWRRFAPAQEAGALVAIGKVLRPHGVRGEFKVQVLCSGAEHFLECVATGEVFLQREGLPGAFLAHIESVREIPDGFLVALGEAPTRTEAEALRGAILGLPEGRLPACEPGTYYFHELEGLRVVDARDGAEIGAVVRVDESPGHDQLIVRPPAPGEREFLIPFVAAFVARVDLAGRCIEVTLPPRFAESQR